MEDNKRNSYALKEKRQTEAKKIIKMFKRIEHESSGVLYKREICYLFHYLTGIFEMESTENCTVFGSRFVDWMYEWLVKNGYNINFSYYWYKMIYSVAPDEERAWELFFRILHEYFEQMDLAEYSNISVKKIIDVKKLLYIIQNRPGVAVGEKNIGYVTHYFAGFFGRIEKKDVSDHFLEISDWVYNYLVDAGHNIKKEIWWHKMIYQVTDEEENAWDLLFEILNDYYERKGDL